MAAVIRRQRRDAVAVAACRPCRRLPRRL